MRRLPGMEAVVVGRSTIVGKPLAQLLLDENATVTVAHSKTRDLPAVCRRADLVFAAVGRPEMVRGDWIKPGATVIDVGINRVPGADGKSRIVGDVAFAEAAKVAGAITPVPGGVGPMTIACLLVNTLRAACAISRITRAGGLAMKTAALTIAFALLAAPAAAQSVEYVYTKFDAKTCKHTKGKAEEDYGSWLCPGYKNLAVRLSAGDQRMYVTLGTGRRTTSRRRKLSRASTASTKAPWSGASRSAPTARNAPSPRSCAGIWSPPRIRKRPRARLHPPAACWS